MTRRVDTPYMAGTHPSRPVRDAAEDAKAARYVRANAIDGDDARLLLDKLDLLGLIEAQR